MHAVSVPVSPPAPRSFADIGDLEAIDEVARGNREMFEVIVRRYNQMLYRIGMAYLHDHAQAEDAMQNTYVKVFLNLGRFQRGAAFSTWLTRIMINECLMLIRRHKRANRDGVEVGRLDREPIAAGSPEPAQRAAADQLNLKEMKAMLETAIAALPRHHRAVYVLRDVQQLSTAETAACLGITSDNVKVTLHRARERLKAGLLKTAAGAELFAYPAFFCEPMTARVLRAVLAVA